VCSFVICLGRKYERHQKHGSRTCRLVDCGGIDLRRRDSLVDRGGIDFRRRDSFGHKVCLVHRANNSLEIRHCLEVGDGVVLCDGLDIVVVPVVVVVPIVVVARSILVRRTVGSAAVGTTVVVGALLQPDVSSGDVD
jgi:hypothetical protein